MHGWNTELSLNNVMIQALLRMDIGQPSSLIHGKLVTSNDQKFWPVTTPFLKLVNILQTTWQWMIGVGQGYTILITVVWNYMLSIFILDLACTVMKSYDFRPVAMNKRLYFAKKTQRELTQIYKYVTKSLKLWSLRSFKLKIHSRLKLLSAGFRQKTITI